MAMNRVQFQHGLSLAEFLKQYGTDEQCEARLVSARWRNGVVCSRGSCKRFALTYNRHRLWECVGCGYQCCSIVGTVFEHTKLRLTQGFLGIYLMTQSNNAVAGLELMRQLGVSYKTAWLVKHRRMQAMFAREAHRRLTDRMEIDDAYLGGDRVGEKHGRVRPCPTRRTRATARASSAAWPSRFSTNRETVRGFFVFVARFRGRAVLRDGGHFLSRSLDMKRLLAICCCVATAERSSAREVLALVSNSPHLGTQGNK